LVAADRIAVGPLLSALMLLQRLQRRDLVYAHHTAVADDIRR